MQADTGSTVFIRQMNFINFAVKKSPASLSSLNYLNPAKH